MTTMRSFHSPLHFLSFEVHPYSYYKDIYFSNTVCKQRQTTVLPSNQQTAAAVSTARIGLETHQSRPFLRLDQSERRTVPVHPAPCGDARIT